MIINTLKYLGNIDDSIHIISPIIAETIQKLKLVKDKDFEKELNINDILIAISISATTSPVAEIALSQLNNIRRLDAHASEILPKDDRDYLKRLGIYLSMEAILNSNNYIL